MIWPAFLAAAFGYLLGSFPSGYLVGRAHGIDIREHGSGNIGATNVLRVLGKKPGILVFVGDALKGWLSARIGWAIGSTHAGLVSHAGAQPAGVGIEGFLTASVAATSQAVTLVTIIAAVGCILGHNFPVWLRFRGGKGIATSAGVLLGMMPLAMAVSVVVWAAVFFTLRYVSVASLMAAAVLPVTVGLLWRGGRADLALFVFSVLAAALAFWRHRANIQRLMAGTEPRFAKKKSEG